MVNFEVMNALRDLDQKTPSFFVAELFAHGDLTMRMNAIRALKRPRDDSTRILIEMLRIMPEQEAPG